ncbi:MAG: DUF1194 domain-containing protein [Paracoccaceae bacterium]|nr:DUF1194 domain-containing protein [Paracoccaceae bacterium]
MRALLFTVVLWAGMAEAACRQALALGLDVSGSVDAIEYRLQLDGVAAALQHPEVRAVLLTMPQAPVRLAVFEWSGPQDQRVILDWVAVSDAEVLAGISDRLRRVQRAPLEPSTAIGAAKAYGARLLAGQSGCWKRTLDLSGDGKSNTGPRPQEVPVGDVTVNGLVIGTPARGDKATPGIGELSSYYNAYVIEGDESFVETALGFEAFEEAMVRKLKRELATLAVSMR